MTVAAKALFFDVFGTLVDWRNGIAREAEIILEPLGHRLDWLAFADAWRDEYQPAMEEVRAGRIPFCKLDVLHRRNLDRILPRFGISGLAEEAAREAQSGLASARCLAGRAAWPCAAEATPPARAGLQRQHLAHGRSRPPQQFSLGRDPGRGDRRRLQAEAARLSRRLRGVRSAARRMHDGGGAHADDLLAAAKCGLRTAHIARPNERGPGTGEAAPKAPVDIAAGSLEDLAAKLAS